MVGNTHFAYAVVNHGLDSQESIANLLKEYETRLREAVERTNKQKKSGAGWAGAAWKEGGTRRWLIVNA